MSIAFKFFLKLHRREKNKQTHAFQLQGEFSEMLAGHFHVQKCPMEFFMFCNRLSLNNTHYENPRKEGLLHNSKET
jgi:hypothetical protein